MTQPKDTQNEAVYWRCKGSGYRSIEETLGSPDVPCPACAKLTPTAIGPEEFECMGCYRAWDRNNYGDNCPYCEIYLMPKEPTALPGVEDYIRAHGLPPFEPTAPPAQEACQHKWVAAPDDIKHCDLCGLFDPDLDCIPAQEAKSGWIDVSQELPPEMTYVLVNRVGYKDTTKNGIDTEFMQQQSFWFTYAKHGFGVTHWMNLPAPPEVKK